MNQFTNAGRDTLTNNRARKGSAVLRRVQAIDLTASAGLFITLLLLTIATLAPAASWNDDSRYVSIGPNTGYYIVRPGSSLSYQLSVEAAPTIDTADPFRHGYGADALGKDSAPNSHPVTERG